MTSATATTTEAHGALVIATARVRRGRAQAAVVVRRAPTAPRAAPNVARAPTPVPAPTEVPVPRVVPAPTEGHVPTEGHARIAAVPQAADPRS